MESIESGWEYDYEASSMNQRGTMGDPKMAINKTIMIIQTSVLVMSVYLVSIPAGEFVAIHDAGMGQIVFFLAVISGMILFYGAGLLHKRYS